MTDRRAVNLREAVAAYGVDLEELTTLASERTSLWAAFRGREDVGIELGTIIGLLADLLTPALGERFPNHRHAGAWLSLAMGTQPAEELWVLNLTTKSELVRVTKLYRGSAMGANIRSAEVFRECITLNCTRVILAHNHPSGDAKPSPEDVEVTRRVVQAGRQLDIEVLDHIVVGHGSWTSLREVHAEIF